MTAPETEPAGQQPKTPHGNPGIKPAVVWDSTQLMQGETEVLIQHGPQTYRLRVTRQGKLILNK